jgi:osmotically-inducible protein OsmY
MKKSAATSTLQHDVLSELEWDPSIDATQIGVTADSGVVTLTGHVSSFFDKWSAERIAKRVHGVKGVANEIEVRLVAGDERDDGEIAKAAVEALSWNSSIPPDRIKVIVSRGYVTLEGNLEWQYQKRAAEDTVRALKGVVGVANQIHVAPMVRAIDVKGQIESALKRSAEVDAGKISVESTDGSVTLRGTVRTWAEHDDAIDAAWAAPGVRNVVDELRVRV